MLDTVKIGAVTTRRGHKLHLAEGGRADCPVVRGRHIISGGTQLRAEHLPLLCKRCLGGIRQAITDAANAAVAAEGNTYRENTVQELAALARALETPAERRAREARTELMVREITASLEPQPAPAPRLSPTVADLRARRAAALAAALNKARCIQAERAQVRPRSLRDIRDEFAAANR